MAQKYSPLQRAYGRLRKALIINTSAIIIANSKREAMHAYAVETGNLMNPHATAGEILNDIRAHLDGETE